MSAENYRRSLASGKKFWNHRYTKIHWLRSHERTHEHTHPFNDPLSRSTRVSQYQKGKTNLDFTEARHSEWQWHQLICKSALRCRQKTMPAPHHSGHMKVTSNFIFQNNLTAPQSNTSLRHLQWFHVMWNTLKGCAITSCALQITSSIVTDFTYSQSKASYVPNFHKSSLTSFQVKNSEKMSVAQTKSVS